MPSVSFGIIQTGVKAGAEIRPGDTVMLKIIKPLAGGKYQVSHNGRPLIVDSNVELKAGQVIRTKASTSGPHLLLRLLQNPTSPVMENSSRQFMSPIREHSLVEALVQAFQKAGLSVDTPMFGKAKAAFAKAANKTRTAARILAALAEKDISPENSVADYITSILGSDTKSGENTPRRRGNRDGAETPNLKSLIEQLKLQIETPDDRESPLHLFNHLKGKDESWILLPYNVKQSGSEVTGTIRLRVGRSGDIRRVALDAFAGRTPYTVAFNWPLADGEAVKVGCADKGMLRAFFSRANELPEKLRNLDSINDDNNIEDDCFDGLALEKISTIEGVDKFA